MKYLIITVFTLYIGACSSPAPASSAPAPAPAPSVSVLETASVDAACRDYLATKFVKTIRGITLHRERPDLYIAGADVDATDGRQQIYDLMVREYDDRGRKYWKAEDLSAPLVELLKGERQ